MRGQLSLEWVLDILIVLALIGAMLGALDSMGQKAGSYRQFHAERLRLESQARSIDGLGSSFRYGSVQLNGTLRVDGGRILQSYGDRDIELTTLFRGSYEKEPV